MKSIDLKISDSEYARPDEAMTTAFLIEHVLNIPPKDGFTLKDFRKRDRITTKLENSNGHLELEDTDYQELKELVNAAKWPGRSKFIWEFLESFESK